MQRAPVMDVEMTPVSRDPVPVGLAVESRERQIEIDVPTLSALSAVAWVLADVLHEIVGHAGAAVLLGVPVRAVSTTTVYLGWDEVDSLTDVRTIHAAATVLNLATGCLALLALRSHRMTSSASRCFLWLFATISFVVVTLQLLVGADWEVVTTGLEPGGFWSAGVFAAGVLVGVAGYMLPLRLWMPDLRAHRRLQLQITAIPVAVLIVVQALSVVRSPFAAQPLGAGDNALITVVALSLFFGVWLALVNLVQRPRSTAPVESIRLIRSKTWLAAGLIVFVVFVAVLGPGLGPLEEDPRVRQGLPASVVIHTAQRRASVAPTSTSSRSPGIVAAHARAARSGWESRPTRGMDQPFASGSPDSA